jgi:hypothetical protein
MKTEVKIYSDAAYSAQMTAEINQAKQEVETLLQVYKDVNRKALPDKTFTQFVNRPQDTTKQAFLNAVEPPAGLNRDRYLDLIEIPVSIGSMKNTPVMWANLFTYSDGVLSLNEEQANKLIHGKDIVLENNSVAHRAWQSLIVLLNTYNDLFEKFGIAFINSADILRVADPVWDSRGNYSGKYTASPQKFIETLLPKFR